MSIKKFVVNRSEIYVSRVGLKIGLGSSVAIGYHVK